MSREIGITRHALGSCFFMHVVVPKPLHTFGRHTFLPVHAVVPKPLHTFGRHTFLPVHAVVPKPLHTFGRHALASQQNAITCKQSQDVPVWHAPSSETFDAMGFQFEASFWNEVAACRDIWNHPRITILHNFS